MAQARTNRRRNRRPRSVASGAEVGPSSSAIDPARPSSGSRRAGGVRRDVHGGAAAARHWPPDRRGPRRAVRRLRPRRLRRHRRPRLPTASAAATRIASSSSRGAAPSRGSPTAAPAPAPLAAVAVAHRLRRRRFAGRRHRRSVLRSLRFRLRIRFRCRTPLRRHRLPRPAAGRRQPAPPAAPWRLPAYAPVRRGR